MKTAQTFFRSLAILKINKSYKTKKRY